MATELMYEDSEWMKNGMAQLNGQRESLNEKEALDVHVILKAGEKSINAHRHILAAFSEYFGAMFKHEMEESKKKEVDIFGINGDILEYLIEFIYTGKVKLTVENVREIIMGADMLQLFQVVKAGADFAKNHINVENALEMRQMSNLVHNCEELRQVADRYIAQNFTSISQSKEFLNLAFSDLKSLLESDHLNVSNQEKVYEAVIGWIKAKREDRRENALELLKCIRLPLIGSQYITETIRNEEILKDIPGFLEMLLDIWSFKAGPIRYDLWPRMTPRNGWEVIYMIGKKNGHFVIESFDPSNKKYELICSNGPLYRTDFTATIMGQKIYVIGGQVNGLATKIVEAYDLTRNVWVTEAQLNVGREGAVSATIDGKIIVFGGENSHGHLLMSAECLGPLSGDNANNSVWTLKSPMNCERYCERPASVALNGNFYVFGGCDSNCDERYNVTEDRWDILDADQIHKFNGGLAATVLNNQIFVCGGYEKMRSFYSFNTKTQKWTQLPDMQLERVCHSLVALNGKLYAFGGVYLDKNTFIECFDFGANEWNFIEYGGQLEVHCLAKSCIGPIVHS